MKTIRIDSSVSTELEPALAQAHEIEIEDGPVGEGGFGVAYRAVRFDGRQVTPQILKILTDNGSGMAEHGYRTVQELQSRLRTENRNAGGLLLRNYPALQAVPQLSFEGTLKGNRVVGYCANDLTKRGFDDFSHILDDDAKHHQLMATPADAKMQIASELVAAFDFLNSRIRFIHADIKAEALFIDIINFHCAIIDFDSGALARDANDSPSTFGTKQDWLAPEIITQIDAPGNTVQSVNVNVLSDVWSVNVAIHYLFTGLHPLFFFTEVSERSINAYHLQHAWPDADPRFGYFSRQYTNEYRQYRSSLNSHMPPEVLKRLAQTFNQGYRSPAQRTLYGQWRIVLKALNQPAIRSFSADRVLVDDGKPVHLSWDVTGAKTLELVGHGDVTGRTSTDITVSADTTFELLLTAQDGSRISKTVSIAVDRRPPDIATFQSTAYKLVGATPVRLTWSVKRAARIQINPIGDVSLLTHVDVLPRTDTVYVLTATSYFGTTATASLALAVPKTPPKIDFFHADSRFLDHGDPVTLAWQVSDADRIDISGIGSVNASGSRRIEQRRATTYRLTATSFFGFTANAEVSVGVSNAPPVIKAFLIHPVIVREGGEAQMSWSVAGAERIRLDPDHRDLPQAGSEGFRPRSSTKFVLTATSWYGAIAERRAEIRVITTTKLDRTLVTKRDRSLVTKRPSHR